MNFRIIYNQTEDNIVVVGEFEEYKHEEQLMEFLNLLQKQNFYITFLEANIVPRNIVEKLFTLQEDGRCTIFVLERYLYSYLQNLGIKCKYTEAHWCFNKLENKLPNEKQTLNKEDVYIFLNELNNVYGYDYTDYQIDSISRRINVAMIKEGICDFALFKHKVLNNQKLFHNLFLDFSINTTEFFRDPEVFALIKNKILPYLDSYNHIKIWCAGCSTGKEVYSLAIMLEEAGMLGKTQIYATDLNPYVIEEGKNGMYSTGTLDKDINNYRNAQGEKSFIQYFDITKGYIKVKSELMKNILFFHHSLLSNGTLNEFNLILCRNVFIYFNDGLQEKILRNFYNSLDNNGFLVLGKSEGIQRNNGEKYFCKYDEKLKVYTRIYS
ncbi:CheR family methyltransferase [Clostridium saccharobutylicum]|uniref:Chemotaxis protein methyltransferase CheR n=1 Tax=Clostridium saccharobutylicum DSM 13864 TaxID=1345695 RepID=U5MQT6_CLOSA|nr:protein-glutamate O-methyltransferase CheR [Clostridium saccharobutylicum]AGX43169.1 chemotaxis protein methyltransferase CheR [Clostridium saccharobutylicum DSM 13864]AQR90470.1 chemotaxis protein methyltransferase cher2 [Clostridium saccharobutylicum]AQS00376.1 chemotaxis protein methyltransferase cher2 [Clostridium saccharobutylicum]AQS14359.1 chemotaxis protein methyltransferase cher2 [Clostridium saccharobutylicum]MBA2906642.1 chemotaxis protein methyltransferase CheR [Clostridium sacc